jgi:hypothetical protein
MSELFLDEIILRCPRRRLGQNPTLRGVKTTAISGVTRNTKQRLEVVRGVHCSHQCIFRTPNESNPAWRGQGVKAGNG